MGSNEIKKKRNEKARKRQRSRIKDREEAAEGEQRKADLLFPLLLSLSFSRSQSFPFLFPGFFISPKRSPSLSLQPKRLRDLPLPSLGHLSELLS